VNPRRIVLVIILGGSVLVQEREQRTRIGLGVYAIQFLRDGNFGANFQELETAQSA
jgi:hypothetical protein